MYRALDYFENFVIFAFVFSGCASVSSFASIVGIFVGITNSAVWLTIWAILTGIEKSQVSHQEKETNVW